jgi:hypothetical protein
MKKIVLVLPLTFAFTTGMTALMLFLAGWSDITLAGTCNANCNAQCCRSVQVTPWDRNDVCDPACKDSCEISKRACRATGISPPILPNPVNVIEQACAAGFTAIVKSVVAAYTGQDAPTPVGAARAFDKAKTTLTAIGLFRPEEFAGVNIRFCRLTGRNKGFTYDRDRICITDHYSDGTHEFDLTSVLAHEMFHVRQYRARGTDNFKCEYSKQLARCGGCFDRGMDIERDAYDFQDFRANPLIADYFHNCLPLSPGPTGVWASIVRFPMQGCSQRLP